MTISICCAGQSKSNESHPIDCQNQTSLTFSSESLIEDFQNRVINDLKNCLSTTNFVQTHHPLLMVLAVRCSKMPPYQRKTRETAAAGDFHCHGKPRHARFPLQQQCPYYRHCSNSVHITDTAATVSILQTLQQQCPYYRHCSNSVHITDTAATVSILQTLQQQCPYYRHCSNSVHITDTAATVSIL